MAFLPGDEPQKPKTLTFESRSDNLPSFTRWLQETRGLEPCIHIMALMVEYAEYVRKSEEEASRLKAELELRRIEASKTGIWCNGIHHLPGPKGVQSIHLRKIYRQGVYERWLVCGWKDKKMPWRRIANQPEAFIQKDVRPEGIQILRGDRVDIRSLRKIIKFFIAHQNGSIPWEKGLIFKPAGDFPVQKFEVPIPGPVEAEPAMSLDIHSIINSFEGATYAINAPSFIIPPIVTTPQANFGSIGVPTVHDTNHIAAQSQLQQTGQVGQNPQHTLITSYFPTLKPTHQEIHNNSNPSPTPLVEARALHANPNSSTHAGAPVQPMAAITPPIEVHASTRTARAGSRKKNLRPIVTAESWIPVLDRKALKAFSTRKRTASEAGIGVKVSRLSKCGKFIVVTERLC